MGNIIHESKSQIWLMDSSSIVNLKIRKPQVKRKDARYLFENHTNTTSMVTRTSNESGGNHISHSLWFHSKTQAAKATPRHTHTITQVHNDTHRQTEETLTDLETHTDPQMFTNRRGNWVPQDIQK